MRRSERNTNMIQVYKSKKMCSGCTACEQICSVKAIEMKPDEKGFLYPVIQQEKCIDCGRCKKICPIHNAKKDIDHYEVTCWAMHLLDKRALKESSSGGVAYGVSEYVIRNHGVVYGAVYTEKKEVIHKRVENLQELYMLQGTKYVQSKLGEVFQNIRKDLEASRMVLFIGTMCQILGLKAFLGKEYKQLYTMDIICFGVPSPWLYKKYLQEEVQKYLPCNINMRDKSTGWRDSSCSLKREGKILKTVKINDLPYIRLFLNSYGLRDSCFYCPFKGSKHSADLTVGDCWGADFLLNLQKEQMKDDGMSMVFVNSKKGESLLNEAGSIFWKKEISVQAAIQANPMMMKTAVRPIDEKKFWEDIKIKSIRKTAYQYVPRESLILRIKKSLYPLKQWIFTIVKGK